MTAKKVFYAMLGVIILVTALTIGGLVGGVSMLQKKSAELVELKLQDRLIEEQELALVRAKADIAKYEELEAISKAIVPRDKDQAKTVRELVNIAEQSNITITGITFPTSSLGTKQPTAPAAGSTNSGTTTAVPTAPPLTQVKPVAGINGLYQLEVTIQTGGPAPTYNQFLDFLSRIEQNRRTAQITSLSVQPTKINRNFVTFNITMNIFVKP